MSRRMAELFPNSRLGCKLLQCASKGLNITRRRKQSIHPILDDFCRTAISGRHHREPGSHSFDYHSPKWFSYDRSMN